MFVIDSSLLKNGRNVMLFGLTFCISSNISSSHFLAVTLYQVELQDGVDNKEVSSLVQMYMVVIYMLKCIVEVRSRNWEFKR